MHKGFGTIFGKWNVCVCTIIGEIKKEQIQVKRKSEEVVPGTVVGYIIYLAKNTYTFNEKNVLLQL